MPSLPERKGGGSWSAGASTVPRSGESTSPECWKEHQEWREHVGRKPVCHSISHSPKSNTHKQLHLSTTVTGKPMVWTCLCFNSANEGLNSDMSEFKQENACVGDPQIMAWLSFVTPWNWTVISAILSGFYSGDWDAGAGRLLSANQISAGVFTELGLSDHIASFLFYGAWQELVTGDAVSEGCLDPANRHFQLIYTSYFCV